MAAIDELIDELREAARYLERRGIDRGCQDSSLSAGLANRAADTIETLSSPASSSPAEAEALPDGVEAAAICERQALQYLNGEPPTATGRMYQRACRDCAEAIRAAALSPAPAQAGSQKDMSAHPRGSGPGPSSVEATLRAAVQAVTDATSAYLPPDGISKDECINRVLAATDNPEINAVMLGGPNGRS